MLSLLFSFRPVTLPTSLILINNNPFLTEIISLRLYNSDTLSQLPSLEFSVGSPYIQTLKSSNLQKKNISVHNTPSTMRFTYRLLLLDFHWHLNPLPNRIAMKVAIVIHNFGIENKIDFCSIIQCKVKL